MIVCQFIRGARGIVAVCALLAAVGLSTDANAQTKECQRAEFEAVVDEAGRTLRQINGQQKPKFQMKLRALREKRGWSDKEFRQKATPFVQDEETTKYDERIRQRLFDITNLGTSESESATTADCKLLNELRSALGDLVEALEGKWSYLFAKIDKALAE